MQEKLVSYLLGELNADEAAELERQLEADSTLAAQLERLRACLDAANQAESLNHAGDTQTPDGLADRTADSVEMLVTQLIQPQSSAPSDDRSDAPTSRCSFSMLDAAVAVGVVAAVAMMLLPALQESRDSSRRIQCENHLTTIGRSLEQYAANHGGFFPVTPPNANAGSFTIILADSGYIDRDKLTKSVICPGSPEANQVANGKIRVRIPTFNELEAAQGLALMRLQRFMSLNVASRLPYRTEEGLRPIRDEDRYRQPLLSDSPTIVNNIWRSLNHGGYGVNVLYQDGSVRHHVDFREPVRQDHFFLNADGQQTMPTSPEDAVLVRSEYVPRVSIPVRVRARFRLVPVPPTEEPADR